MPWPLESSLIGQFALFFDQSNARLLKQFLMGIDRTGSKTWRCELTGINHAFLVSPDVSEIGAVFFGLLDQLIPGHGFEQLEELAGLTQIVLFGRGPQKKTGKY